MTVRVRGITQWTKLQYLVGVQFMHLDSRSKNLLAGLLTCLADGNAAEVVKEAIAAEMEAESRTRSSVLALAVELPKKSCRVPHPRQCPRWTRGRKNRPLKRRKRRKRGDELEEDDWSAVLHFLKDGSQLAGVVTGLNQDGCSVRTTEPFIAGIHIRVKSSFACAGYPSGSPRHRECS